MNRFRILTAAVVTAGITLFAGTVASGSEKVGKQEGLSCTAVSYTHLTLPTSDLV